MSHQFGVNDSGMNGIHSNTAAAQSFRQFSHEQNVSQFTLTVGVGLVV